MRDLRNVQNGIWNSNKKRKGNEMKLNDERIDKQYSGTEEKKKDKRSTGQQDEEGQ